MPRALPNVRCITAARESAGGGMPTVVISYAL